MTGMELDSSGGMGRGIIPRLSPRDRIVQRLATKGIPREVLEQLQMGLISFLKDNKAMSPGLVSSILPTEDDISELQSSLRAYSGGAFHRDDIEDLFGESMVWLEWLMFEAEPRASLENLAIKAVGQRGVCGAVWGQNDLAYRCHTCEHDSTCAICVPCFQNGNHKDHDYSIIYTAGGCCDCGDVTAWKREGFCSKHKGTEEIQPLPEDLANTVRPVLDALLVSWKDKVTLAENQRSPRECNQTDVSVEMGDKLSSAVIEVLLDFCKCSESLLSFISKRMFECIGLLDVLVRAERFLHENVVKKLHELLLKLIGEPVFKYEFAVVFTRYYLVTVSEFTKECSDKMLENYPLLSTFSVQIFTVPPLTLQLVQEVNLLGVFLGCLKDLFLICVGEDGQLQVSKWANLHVITNHLVEDTRFVLSHEEVLVYITHERPDISRAWLKLLSLVQGMDPQKRVTTTPTEEGYEHISSLFLLGHLLGNINNLFVKGAFPAFETKEMNVTSFCCSDFEGLDDNEGHHHAKAGKISEESSACSTSSRNGGLDHASKYLNVKLDGMAHLCVPSPAVWLIIESLKTIDGWLLHARNFSHCMDDAVCSGFNSFRKKIFRLKKGTNINRALRTSTSRQGTDGDQLLASGEHHGRFGSVDTDMYPEYTASSGLSDDSIVDVYPSPESETLGLLNMADWPDIVYDVGSQEISFHIPLHHLLSLILCKAMKDCYGEIDKLEKASCESSLPSSARVNDFFKLVLGGSHPCGFSAFLMEHPLQLRVFCSQVLAGMWHRNYDASLLRSEFYRTVRWFNQGLESDLFLLQCCAALAPPELFVERIQERFGLLSYTSLNHSECNEYEAILVHEMLALIIQIIKERYFSGLSSVDNLKRELIFKLVVGDATHSQLVKALPHDLSKSDQLQNVLDMVATYSKPSGMNQGKYSLREAYWKELDLYHPRWNYRDLQVAEERYFRFCKVSARNVQLPRWTNVYDPLKTISRIATSKAVLKIVRAVFFYAAFADISSMSHAPDEILITALHLLSLALDVCGSLSQTYVTNYASGINLSYPDDHSCMEVPHHAEDLYPILAYATEELDATAHDESALCKNQSMLSLLVSLMRKYKEESESIDSETRHCNISSLIGALLKKFAELDTNCSIVLQKLAPEVVCDMLKEFAQVAPQISASASDAEERRAKARERQAAIIEKMRAQQSRFIASLKSRPNSEADGLISKEEESNLEDLLPEESAIVCSLCRDPHSQSHLSFLIFLQKSRLSTFVERGPLSWKDIGQKDKEIQVTGIEGSNYPSGVDSSSIVQLVQNAGVRFYIEPAEVDTSLVFLKEQLPDTRNIQTLNMFSGAGTEVTIPLETLEDDIFQSVVRERDNSKSSDAVDGEKGYLTKDAVVGSREVQKTEFSVLGEHVAFLSGESKRNRSSIDGLHHISNLSSRSIASSATISRFGPNDCDGIHISSCGHAVHQECHDRYLLFQRYNSRRGFEGSHIVDPDLGELLCPVCRRLANTIFPASTSVSNKFSRMKASVVSSSMSNDVFSTSSDTSCSNLHILLALSLLQSTAKTVGQSRILEVLSGKLNETMNSALGPALQKLYELYSPHRYGSLSTPGKLSKSLILWDTLKYSITSTEIAARAKLNTHSVSSQSFLESLNEELQSSSGYMMSVLLHVVQSTRNCNGFEVLLRFSSLQLLAGSICSGVSGDNYLSNGDKQRGTVPSSSEFSDNGEVFPDIEFWKHAADPILGQDPFSSLMWVLFCLPVPFIFSRECFTALVHLFYVVCVVQAIITCYGKQSFDMSSFGGGPLNDICKEMAECELMRQYFISSYIDPLCLPNDMIRQLTFPYLRRCALLWKLLNSLTSAPLYGHTWERLYRCPKDTELDRDNHLRLDLDRIRELEDMFKICSFELVLKDEVVHALALRWCVHFRKEFRVRKYRGVLASTPAVPFKLMELPLIYQDLLERYIELQCSNCKNVPEEPALCLLCGKLSSPDWNSCCRESKCLNHAKNCGAGIGVFLLVRKSTILLQRLARQTFWPSLYLDAFGEEDHYINRGKPLYLSKERYTALTYLVASHGLDQHSEVLQQTTISLNGFD